MVAYEPGTVAVATVRGKKGVRVFRTASARNDAYSVWRHPVVDGHHSSYPCDVTDIRPLVVLDPDEDLAVWRTAEGLVPSLRRYAKGLGSGHPAGSYLLRTIADRIEAQTKPPRIPEPGLWGVVEASCPCDEERVQFVQWSGGSWRDRGVDAHYWGELINPTLIRDGVS